jgi:hypothetical protein
MRIFSATRVGLGLLVVAGVVFCGGKRWVETRTLRAVNIPISLARGTVSTGTFVINAHGFYSINIVRAEPGNLACNGVALTTRSITSLDGLPVYRQPEEQSAAPRNVTIGSFLGTFEGKPGRYDLAIEILSDTGCLRSLRPRLNITASDDDFYRWNQHYESLCAISFLASLLGVVLIVSGAYGAIQRRSDANGNFSILK